MQITVKSTKVGKTGKSDKGDWELIVVKSEDGTDYTTFHKSAKNLSPGTVIDIGEPKIKDGKISFKEFTVVSAPAAAPAPASANGQSGMSPEAWAEKDRLECRSREANTCFMGLTTMASSPDPLKNMTPDTIARYHDALNAAMVWATAHFTKPVSAKTEAKPEAKAEPTEADMAFEAMGDFKDLGAFLTRAMNELKMGRAEICEKLSINDVKEITDFAKDWATLAQKPATKKEPEAKQDRPETVDDIPFSS